MIVDIKGVKGYEIAIDSVNIDDSIGQRSTATFTVIDKHANLHFEQGMPVEIGDYADKLYIHDGFILSYNATARISLVKGRTELINGEFISVNGTLENHSIPILRSVNNVCDEISGSFINRRIKQMKLKDYHDIKGEGTQDGYYLFSFNNILNIPTNNVTSTIDCYARGLDIIIKIPEAEIDYIISQHTDLKYEWKLEKLTTTINWIISEYIWSTTKPEDTDTVRWIATGEVRFNDDNKLEAEYRKEIKEEIQVWEDTGTRVWSALQPDADEGFRYVKTGAIDGSLFSTVEACKIYVTEHDIEVLFEARPISEPIEPMFIKIKANQPINIDTTLETEIIALTNYKLYFKGFIDVSEEKTDRGVYAIDNPNKWQMRHVIDCKGNYYLADKRIIAKGYVNMYCKDILRDIYDTYLKQEGIVWIDENIMQGEFLEEVAFNYIKVSKAIERLAEMSKFIWDIDNNRVLHFKTRTIDYNNTPITEKDCLYTPRVKNGNQDYRNKQYEFGKGLTDLLIENFISDGTNKSYTLTFPVAEMPTIKINGIAVNQEVIGLKNEEYEEGHIIEWLWSKDDNVISQHSDVEALPLNTTVTIEYRGIFNTVVAIPQQAEIDKRAELEGNTGIVERIETDTENLTLTETINSATAKLDKYAVDGKQVTITTFRNDLKVGQTVRVNIPKHDIDEDMLVEWISKSTEDNILINEVTLIIGPEATSFYKMFEKATQPSNKIIRENISEQEAIVRAFDVTKTWLESELPNIFSELYPGENLYPGSEIYPIFEINQRVKYLELLSGDEVLLRVYRLKQTQTDNEIVTTFYVKNNEALGNITTIKFYGGEMANEEINSGTLIDSINFNYNKTNLEILQFFRIDTKGW